jgi:hypothetical protein
MGDGADEERDDRECEAGDHDTDRGEVEIVASEAPPPRRRPAWEDAEPVTVSITVDSHCVPIERRIPRNRQPIHEAALALLEKGGVRTYEVAQALDSVAQFWERFSSGDADLEDFKDDFTGEKRRARKKAEAWLAKAIELLEPEDECPACKCGTVELNEAYELVCRGECGNVLRPAPEAVCEKCGEECDYHPEVCLCEKCQAETGQSPKGGHDDEEGSRDDGDSSSGEAEDQGAR